jgi:RNA polymerase sigma factor (sigma-70 family)
MASSGGAVAGWDLDTLYRAHADRVRRVAVRRLGDPHFAEDVVQDTFAWLHEHPEKMAAAGSAEAYVVSIAVHLCFGVLRERRYAGYAAPADPVELHRRGRPMLWNGPALGDEPGREMIGRVEADAVRAALTMIDPDHRDLLRLRAVDGLAYDVIAQRSGTSLEAVRAKMTRARTKAKAAYRTVTRACWI